MGQWTGLRIAPSLLQRKSRCSLWTAIVSVRHLRLKAPSAPRTPPTQPSLLAWHAGCCPNLHPTHEQTNDVPERIVFEKTLVSVLIGQVSRTMESLHLSFLSLA